MFMVWANVCFVNDLHVSESTQNWYGSGPDTGKRSKYMRVSYYRGGRSRRARRRFTWKWWSKAWRHRHKKLWMKWKSRHKATWARYKKKGRAWRRSRYRKYRKMLLHHKRRLRWQWWSPAWRLR